MGVRAEELQKKGQAAPSAEDFHVSFSRAAPPEPRSQSSEPRSQSSEPRSQQELVSSCHTIPTSFPLMHTFHSAHRQENSGLSLYQKSRSFQLGLHSP